MSFGRGLLYIASAAGLALLVRSFLIGPVPLWIALVAFFAYVVLALLGVFVPRLEMFADIVCKGPRNVPEVALTFDDGPHPEHTRKVLDLLDDAEAKATFFVLGSKVEEYPEVAREIVKRGHGIGVHGYTHDRIQSLRGPKRIQVDLERALQAVEKATGHRPTLFRPPVGLVSPRTETAATQLGLTIVGWSVKGRDGLARAEPRDVAARVRRGLRPGAIVLLHDAAEEGDRRPAGVDALQPILAAIHGEGLKAVDVAKFVERELD